MCTGVCGRHALPSQEKVSRLLMGSLSHDLRLVVELSVVRGFGSRRRAEAAVIAVFMPLASPGPPQPTLHVSPPQSRIILSHSIRPSRGAEAKSQWRPRAPKCAPSRLIKFYSIRVKSALALNFILRRPPLVLRLDITNHTSTIV